MKWDKLMPHLHMVCLLEGEFFPRWLAVLIHWLQNDPDFEEVSGSPPVCYFLHYPGPTAIALQVRKWYLGWKSEFPSHLQNDPSIKASWNIALSAMNEVSKVSLRKGARPFSLLFLATVFTGCHWGGSSRESHPFAHLV